MINRQARKYVSGLAFLLASAATAFTALPSVRAASDEAFTSFRGDDSHSGFIDLTLPHNLALAWQNSQVQAYGNVSSPVVSGHRIFYGQGPHIYALDSDTGALIWQYPTDPTIAVGAFASPLAFDGKQVFAGNDDGDLICFAADTGAVLWHFRAAGSVHVAPTIRDGVVYIAGGNQLYALEEGSGTSMWAHACAVTSSIVTSPTLGDDTMYVASANGAIWAIRSNNGSILWNIPVSASPSASGAVVVTNGQILARNGNTLEFLSARSGDFKGQVICSAPITQAPAVADDGALFIVTSDRKVTSMTDHGKEIWTTVLPELPSAPPLVTHDNVVICSQNGTIFLLARETGDIVWTYGIWPTVPLGSAAPLNVPILCAPVVANGALYVLSDDGTMSSFDAYAPDSTGPVVLALYPPPTATISGVQIPWQISAVDIGSGILASSVVLTVDSHPIPVQYDIAQRMIHVKLKTSGTGRVLSGPIDLDTLPDGPHTAKIVASDWRGNILTKSWTFTVDKTYPAPTPFTSIPVQIGTSTISDNPSAPISGLPTAVAAIGAPVAPSAAAPAPAASNGGGGGGATTTRSTTEVPSGTTGGTTTGGTAKNGGPPPLPAGF